MKECSTYAWLGVIYLFFCSTQQVRNTFFNLLYQTWPEHSWSEKISHFSYSSVYIRIFSKSRYNILHDYDYRKPYFFLLKNFIIPTKLVKCTFPKLLNCRYEKTVPQLLIRWSVQKNYITIPKSTKPERILENTKVFDFTINDKDMRTLVGFIAPKVLWITQGSVNVVCI